MFELNNDDLKLADADKTFVLTENVKAVETAIKEAYIAADIRGTSVGRMVIGESGVGKTTALKYALAKYSTSCLDNTQKKPVVSINLTSSITCGTFPQMILNEYGVSGPAENSDRRLIRAIKTMKHYGTKVLVVDEAQHLCDRNRKKEDLYKAADYVAKCVINEGISVLLVGLEKVETLVQTNEQVRGRFNKPLVLKTWEEDPFNEMVALIVKICTAAGFHLPTILEDKHTYFLVRQATNMNVRYVKKLILGAIENAMKEGRKILEFKDLNVGFRQYCEPLRPGRDPFSKSYDKQPLTGRNEQFYKEAF